MTVTTNITSNEQPISLSDVQILNIINNIETGENSVVNINQNIDIDISNLDLSQLNFDSLIKSYLENYNTANLGNTDMSGNLTFN